MEIRKTGRRNRIPAGKGPRCSSPECSASLASRRVHPMPAMKNSAKARLTRLMRFGNRQSFLQETSGERAFAKIWTNGSMHVLSSGRLGSQISQEPSKGNRTGRKSGRNHSPFRGNCSVLPVLFDMQRERFQCNVGTRWKNRGNC